jgi:Protein of unknown function (DUF2924)
MRKRSSLPQIADLPKMNASQLQGVHRELFGEEHRIANCQHLRQKTAWHLQAAKDGGLSESVRQYPIAIARGTELRLRISENASRRQAGVPLEQTVTTKVIQTRDARLPIRKLEHNPIAGVWVCFKLNAMIQMRQYCRVKD